MVDDKTKPNYKEEMKKQVRLLKPTKKGRIKSKIVNFRMEEKTKELLDAKLEKEGISITDFFLQLTDAYLSGKLK